MLDKLHSKGKGVKKIMQRMEHCDLFSIYCLTLQIMFH